MAEFCILHLSYLHIKGTHLSKTMLNLIADIKNQVKNIETIFLVITGDIVDRCSYGSGFENYKFHDFDYDEKKFIQDENENQFVPVRFFQKLKVALGDKVIDVQIVPGNHDKDSSSTKVKLASLALQTNDENEESNKWDIWRTQIESYKKFIKLCNFIFKLFNVHYDLSTEHDKQDSNSNKLYAVPNDSDDPQPHSPTYGVEFRQYDNANICFIRMDTAWTTYGGQNEQHKLTIGKKQIEFLREEYQKGKTRIDEHGGDLLTFCIAHHPTSFLKPAEEDRMKEILIDEEYLNVDFFLCGHTHNRSLSHLANHERAMTTLVTGIGWDHKDNFLTEEGGHLQKDRHSYAIYKFDENLNSQTTVMRRTKTNGQFDYDYSYFVSEVEKKSKYILSPLHSRDYPFIKLNNGIPDKHKDLFVDDKTLEDIKKLSNSLAHFSSDCKQIYDNCLKDEANLYEDFQGYLNVILQEFNKNFQIYFDDKSIKRAAFRLYDEETETYPIILEDIINQKQQNAKAKKRPYNWDKLVKKAFESHCPIIYSLNNENKMVPGGKEESDNKIVGFSVDYWDDFILFVPSASGCEMEKVNTGTKEKEKRPLLVFVLSIKLSDEAKIDNLTEKKNKKKN
ncbi:MAG: metallophosphoesterase [Christensenellales bacterium]